MISEGTKNFQPAYTAWVGKPLVMLVGIRQCHAPILCRIVGESAAEVRVRHHFLDCRSSPELKP
jgi:hypothetical protein